jgi:hypothetical protein
MLVPAPVAVLVPLSSTVVLQQKCTTVPLVEYDKLHHMHAFSAPSARASHSFTAGTVYHTLTAHMHAGPTLITSQPETAAAATVMLHAILQQC